jgi:two-component system phosphate regulon response regulator OmpR
MMRITFVRLINLFQSIPMETTVLIVDDDEKLRKLLREYLEGYGFKVLTLSDGTCVIKTIQKEYPDLIILDIMLPKKDGLEILKAVRSEFSIPIIMLTAKGEESDRIVGLELGADDYLPKPFNPRELLSRIKAILRRSKSQEQTGSDRSKIEMIKAGGLILKTTEQVLLIENNVVPLSTAESKIMEALMKYPNTVLTRDRLMTLARGRNFMAFDRSIDVHISNLRSKLFAYPNFRNCIKTVWGSGYMFVEKS